MRKGSLQVKGKDGIVSSVDVTADPATVSIVLLQTKWVNKTQAISITNLPNKKIFINIVPSCDEDVAEYSKISRAVALNDVVTFTCYNDIPLRDLVIQIIY